MRGPGGGAACQQTVRNLWVRKTSGGLHARQVRKTNDPTKVTCVRCRWYADSLRLPELLAEVERLRAESLFARDPRGEPETWVEIEVRAKDPEQRKRTVEWIRKADEKRVETSKLLRKITDKVQRLEPWLRVEGSPSGGPDDPWANVQWIKATCAALLKK